MNKSPQNCAQWSDYMATRKLYLNGIIILLADIKKLSTKLKSDTKVEILTIEAIKAELAFIDLQLKRKKK